MPLSGVEVFGTGAVSAAATGETVGHVSVVGILPGSVEQRVEPDVYLPTVTGQITYRLGGCRYIARAIQIVRAYAGAANLELKVRSAVAGVHEKVTLVPDSGVVVFGAGVVSTACVAVPVDI